jgi:hypothetical protein
MNYYPAWQNKVSFRISGGLYHQSPFIKELKNSDGSININARAQRSWQVVMGTDYLFTAWDRPFRFSAEAYYKLMNRLIPYKIDNVRIRYIGEQEAKGYARGVDMKVNGEFVSGVQSWASISFMKTEEDIHGDDHWSVNADGTRQWVNQGYIPRPTDQWMNFSLFFQDYFPGNPSYKMQLSGFFGSRLPTGPPKSERYLDQFRMPAYRRIDMGLSKVIISPARKGKNGMFRHVNDLWVSLEVLIF